MQLLGDDPFSTIGSVSGAQEEIKELFNDDIKYLSDKYGRENVVMALEGYTFDIRNRNTLNTYDISDELFEEIHLIKSEYDIEIKTNGASVEEFVEQAKYGNPLMMSRHQWPTVEQWETQWSNLRELQDEHGDIVLAVFFDLVLFTEEGYHQRKKYVEGIIEEYGSSNPKA